MVSHGVKLIMKMLMGYIAELDGVKVMNVESVLLKEPRPTPTLQEILLVPSKTALNPTACPGQVVVSF